MVVIGIRNEFFVSYMTIAQMELEKNHVHLVSEIGVQWFCLYGFMNWPVINMQMVFSQTILSFSKFNLGYPGFVKSHEHSTRDARVQNSIRFPIWNHMIKSVLEWDYVSRDRITKEGEEDNSQNERKDSHLIISHVRNKWKGCEVNLTHSWILITGHELTYNGSDSNDKRQLRKLCKPIWIS